MKNTAIELFEDDGEAQGPPQLSPSDPTTLDPFFFYSSYLSHQTILTEDESLAAFLRCPSPSVLQSLCSFVHADVDVRQMLTDVFAAQLFRFGNDSTATCETLSRLRRCYRQLAAEMYVRVNRRHSADGLSLMDACRSAEFHEVMCVWTEDLIRWLRGAMRDVGAPSLATPLFFVMLDDMLCACGPRGDCVRDFLCFVVADVLEHTESKSCDPDSPNHCLYSCLLYALKCTQREVFLNDSSQKGGLVSHAFRLYSQGWNRRWDVASAYPCGATSQSSSGAVDDIFAAILPEHPDSYDDPVAACVSLGRCAILLHLFTLGTDNGQLSAESLLVLFPVLSQHLAAQTPSDHSLLYIMQRLSRLITACGVISDAAAEWSLARGDALSFLHLVVVQSCTNHDEGVRQEAQRLANSVVSMYSVAPCSDLVGQFARTCPYTSVTSHFLSLLFKLWTEELDRLIDREENIEPLLMLLQRANLVEIQTEFVKKIENGSGTNGADTAEFVDPLVKGMNFCRILLSRLLPLTLSTRIDTVKSLTSFVQLIRGLDDVATRVATLLADESIKPRPSLAPVDSFALQMSTHALRELLSQIKKMSIE